MTRVCIALAAALACALAACSGTQTGRGGGAGPKERVILVAGGSGRAGIFVVRRLQADGRTFRATTRSVAEARKRLGPDAEGVEWIEADVRDAVQAEQAVRGAAMIVSVIGSRELSGPNSAEFVDYRGVRNLVDAAVRNKVEHFVLLTAIGTSDRNSFANKTFKGALEWRFKGEEYLRASGLHYTIVRPAGLTNEPAGAKGVRLFQGDDWKSHLRKTISRDDLAMVLLESLRNPGAINATFEVANDPAEAPGTWRAQMTALKAD